MKKIILLLSLFYFPKTNAQIIITTVVGNGSQTFAGDGGLATNCSLFYPAAVAFDKHGNMYITDLMNERVRKINSAGIITTIAGNGTASYSGDGGLAVNATLNKPFGIVVDKLDNVYIADQVNHVIRKIDTAGIITTIAGNNVQGYSGDGGLATNAKLSAPTGVALDTAGILYIADHTNSRIRKVDASGIITTVAGNGSLGFSGDGGLATNAKLYLAASVSFDKKNNMYIADFYNHRIRKVNGSGIIATIAGNGTGTYSGDGGLATSASLYYPYQIVLDTVGNIYIPDSQNRRVRMIDTSGIITTIAGNGIGGYSGDGGLAINAELGGPTGLAFDTLGYLYMADYPNSRIRKVGYGSITTSINNSAVNENQILLFPNPTSDQFFIDANTTDKLNVDLYDLNGRHVFSKSVNDKSNINVAPLDNGAYTMTIKTATRIINKKLIILR